MLASEGEYFRLGGGAVMIILDDILTVTVLRCLCGNEFDIREGEWRESVKGACPRCGRMRAEWVRKSVMGNGCIYVVDERPL